MAATRGTVFYHFRLVANFFDLTSLSNMRSAGFLLIFATVNYANYKLFKKTYSCRGIAISRLFGGTGHPDMAMDEICCKKY